jgi:hypothetical protein
MAPFLNRHEALSIDLRLGYVRRQQARWRGPSISGTAPVVPRPGPESRQAIVKVWGASPGTTGRHLRYLTKGKGTDGMDTTLFNAQGFLLEPKAFIQAAPQDPHQFRLVVSVPDDGQLNLVRFIQAFMRQVARDLRQPLDYVAAVHRDTAYTHTHLVVRGRDTQGSALYVPRHYLHYGLRFRVMHLATAWLGKVPHLDRSRQYQQAQAVSHAMDAQVKEAKKEDTMDDTTQKDEDPSPDVPPATDQTQAGSGQTLVQRLQALIEQRQQAREKVQAKDRGMGL